MRAGRLGRRLGGQQVGSQGGERRGCLVQARAVSSHQRPDMADAQRGQVALQTQAKKWVYANVESDAAWLRFGPPIR